MMNKKIIINDHILSIVPHISTTWKQIIAMHMSGGDLIVCLKGDQNVSVPGLTENEMGQIFEGHARYLERGEVEQPKEEKNPLFSSKAMAALSDPMFGGEQMFRFNIGSMEDMGSLIQHNVEHKNAPDLPQEILLKISNVVKMLAPQDPDLLPKAEPHCNCMHCQIARTISSEEEQQWVVEEPLEEVSDEELTFTQWKIDQTGEKLFEVTDKLSPQEKFTVFLGDPVGCTCGKCGCEHVVAVLKS